MLPRLSRAPCCRRVGGGPGGALWGSALPARLRASGAVPGWGSGCRAVAVQRLWQWGVQAGGSPAAAGRNPPKLLAATGNALLLLQSGQANGTYCELSALVGTLCTAAPGSPGCEAWATLCAAGSVVAQCASPGPVPDAPSAALAKEGIESLCATHCMDGAWAWVAWVGEGLHAPHSVLHWVGAARSPRMLVPCHAPPSRRALACRLRRLRGGQRLQCLHRPAGGARTHVLR